MATLTLSRLPGISLHLTKAQGSPYLDAELRADDGFSVIARAYARVEGKPTEAYIIGARDRLVLNVGRASFTISNQEAEMLTAAFGDAITRHDIEQSEAPTGAEVEGEQA